VRFLDGDKDTKLDWREYPDMSLPDCCMFFFSFERKVSFLLVIVAGTLKSTRMKRSLISGLMARRINLGDIDFGPF
jgi:hypothetical protein